MGPDPPLLHPPCSPLPPGPAQPSEVSPAWLAAQPRVRGCGACGVLLCGLVVSHCEVWCPAAFHHLLEPSLHTWGWGELCSP